MIGSLKRKRYVGVALLAILSAATVLRFYGLATESFWFDEAYSVWVARHSVRWHLLLSTQRIFPPLYYLLLHFWLKLGTSDSTVRALSATIGVASLAVAYGLGRQLFGEKVGLLSALLLAISPLHLYYSQEARMYILSAALALCSAYFMWLVLQRGQVRHWLLYVMSTALAMNAHYFALFLVPFQNLFVLYLVLRRRMTGAEFWRHWIPSQLAIGLLSVVGLAGVFSSESGYWWGLLDTWHGAPRVRELLNLMFSFSLGTTVQGRLIYWTGMALFGFCLLWGLEPRQNGHWALDDALVFAFGYLVVPLGTVFLASQVRSFWVLRYIFPFLPAYCILVARGIGRMPRWLAVPVLIGVLVLSAWPLLNTYRYEQKENWRAVVDHIAESERDNDVIMLLDEDIWLPFEHYYRGTTRWVGVSRTVADRSILNARVGMLLMSYDRVWLVLSHTDNMLLREVLTDAPNAELIGEERFTGVEVELFAVHRDDRVPATP